MSRPPLLLLLALPLSAATCVDNYEERGDRTITIAADPACPALVRREIFLPETEEIITAGSDATFPFTFRVDALRRQINVTYKLPSETYNRYATFEFTSGRDTTFVVGCW